MTSSAAAASDPTERRKFTVGPCGPQLVASYEVIQLWQLVFLEFELGIVSAKIQADSRGFMVYDCLTV